MAEEFLPVAKPAARPEPASVSKPASRPNEPKDTTFGDLIDAASEDEAPKADAADEPNASRDAAAAAAQPAPAQTANPATNSILSMLGDEAGKGEAADGATAKTADATDPAAALLAQMGVTTVAPQTTNAATSSNTAPAAIAAAGQAQPKVGQPGTDAATSADDAPAADATAGAAEEKKPAAATAPVAPKVEKTEADGAPGAQRAADNATAQASASDTSKASSQAQGPSPAAAAVQPNAQQTAQTQAAKAADAPADIKIDALANASTNTSTPAADALTGRTQTADAPKANPAMATASPAVVQVYTRMIDRMDGRAQRFEIRLDPAELGRVDVKIEVGSDKKVHAVLAAHDSAVLSDLMRGQKALERALSDAGIDLADGGLQFEMSQDTGRSLTGNEQREGSSREPGNVWRGFNTVDVGVDADARDLMQATRSYRRAAARLDLVA